MWADKAKQIAETLAAAKKANEAGLGSLSIGNKTAAETSFAEADKQFEKYKSLQEEYYQAGINGERQTTLTRKQQVEAYKQILKDLYAYQETQMKKQQDIASTQQDILKGRAEDVAKGPVDMTEGMDAAKARWIDNWKAAHETTTQMASDSMDMIQTKIGTIRMPTEEWLTSIFTMKGVFIEAVDEMSRKVEAGGKVTGTGKIYTNAVPGKNPIVSNAQAEASAIMAALERARAENTRAAEQAAISAGKQQQAAIVEGSRQGAEVMKQGVAAGGVSAVKAVEVGKNVAANQGLTLGSDITISGIDKAQDRINELKRQIDNLALSKGWASTSEDADVFKEQIASILAELTSFQEKYGALQQQAQAGGIEEMLKVENAAEDVSSLTDRARDLAAAFNNVEVDDTFVTTLTEKIADLGNGTLEFHESWEKDWSDTEKKAKGAVSGIYEYLDELVSRDWTVDVKVREERALGGLIRGYQVGGLIQKLAAGGGVRNMLQGAYLSGYGGGDRRLILGEDGEFMIRKEMVRAAGRDVASDFNAGKWGRVVDKLSNRFQLYDAPRLTGYESGGYIQGGAASTDFSATSTQVIMNFDDTGETATMYGSSRDVDVFSRAMSRKARLRSA